MWWVALVEAGRPPIVYSEDGIRHAAPTLVNSSNALRPVPPAVLEKLKPPAGSLQTWSLNKTCTAKMADVILCRSACRLVAQVAQTRGPGCSRAVL